MTDLTNSTDFVLGIWDGHDAGAALLRGDEIIFAVNEERLTRRKLEAGFPAGSIAACLEYAGLAPGDVRDIAASTFDPAKTLTRLFPGLKEEYYLLRRRKKDPGPFDGLKKAFKYRFTEAAPNRVSAALSRIHLDRRLRSLGFRDFSLHLVDHHAGHAQAAARCSGFAECTVLTLDGVGDGLSGSISRFRRDGRLELIHPVPARVSLGIFFEHATNLLNMRELEDEGKVMALADYAYPIPDEENPLMRLVSTQGTDIVSRFRSNALYREMKKILWRYPSEQFAWMAQRALEENVVRLAREALARAGRADASANIALAGGVFSNVKLNMRIAGLDGVEGVFVFPHMGDGGLALGAAMDVNARKFGVERYRLEHLYLGHGFGDGEIADALEGSGLAFRRLERERIAETAAESILGGEIILWFQGRMELGPRALGSRSILAAPNDGSVKDRLNLALKKRAWYQPFCPSMLVEDAMSILDAPLPADMPVNAPYDGSERRNEKHAERNTDRTLAPDIDPNMERNRFMTTAFRVRSAYRGLMESVTNVDGTCRPHFVKGENPLYRELLLAVKRRLGKGVVLNTSFNIHGEPVARTPMEAVDMLRRTGIRHLFIGDFLVENDTGGTAKDP